MAEPNPRIDGKMGMTGRLSTIGYGSRLVRVTKVQDGLKIISSSGEARSRRAFYPHATVNAKFILTIVFTSWSERESFNRWMRTYMNGVSTGKGTSGYMKVSVPGRRFVRIAVPEGELLYGDAVKNVTYPVDVTFVGIHDPVDDLNHPSLSQMQMPKNDLISKHFYPTGLQVSGADSLEGTFFDPGLTDTSIQTESGNTPMQDIFQNGLATGAIPPGLSYDEWLALP